ncbi:MAG: dTDP-glucose 4,6-dehydratase [Candidatus Binataceae bacterium]
MRTIIVAGGAGFIGSNFVRAVLAQTTSRVVVYDKLTYAGNPLNFRDVKGDSRFNFVRGDITNAAEMESLFKHWQPDAIINFAAETHVDRSIDGPRVFLETNVTGAFEILETARRYYYGLPAEKRDQFRVLHVSTDEVYGSLGPTGKFSESSPYAPNSPYAASKAAADHFVRSYHETYGLPALITNCSNNYGRCQFPEKLIPLMTLNGINGRPLPIYGTGGNVRDWLFVDEHCEGLLAVLERGRPGAKYNLGGNSEATNLEVAGEVCRALDDLLPASANPALASRGLSKYSDLITFVPDRPGHDRRYAIDCSLIQRELGWSPKISLATGIRLTVAWYLENLEWCRSVQEGNYAGERLGLAADGPLR